MAVQARSVGKQWHQGVCSPCDFLLLPPLYVYTPCVSAGMPFLIPVHKAAAKVPCKKRFSTRRAAAIADQRPSPVPSPPPESLESTP